MPFRSIALLWVGYGAGVVAGLMAIGHATGIAKWGGLAGALWIAPMVIAICNMFGSFGGGWLVDRAKTVNLLSGLPLLSTAALVALSQLTTGIWAVCALGVVGLAYGATIAAYPAAIAKLFGIGTSTRIYGRVFTAWGMAGLMAPWFAGFLFDQTGSYSVALYCAAGFGVVSAGAILALFRWQLTRTS